MTKFTQGWERLWLLAFVPAESFRAIAGEETMRDDQFGKKSIHHLF